MRLNRSPRAADERGYIMVAALGILTVLGLLTVVAFAAAGGDIHLSQHDIDEKIAYAAAEAGVADYQYHLNQDTSYWAGCVPSSGPTAVNQYWNGQGQDTRKNWRTVPGTDSQYALELIPANGKTACDPSNAQASMIDTASGTFRIRSTGVTASGVRRSIVATFKRRSFLDYLYFTDFETADPSWAPLDTGGAATRSGSWPSYAGPDYPTWAGATCGKTYWQGGRGKLSWTGQVQLANGSWQNASFDCTEIQFVTGDKVNGPFHTNDEIDVCGSPTFGRSPADAVEVSGSGWRSACAGSNPNFVGTWTPNALHLTPPPSNQSLKRLVDPGYIFTGKTHIVLGTGSLTVNDKSMPYPPNGVIYVANGNCGMSYDPLNPSGDPDGCGDATVDGTYGHNLTITAEKDVVVDGNIVKSGDSMLGLIANNFVRVNHPATHSSSDPTSCTNVYPGTMTNVRIDAAILSLNHSFTVDNYYCGAALGTLTVNGAIAQKYRGPVGTGDGAKVATGYLKNYTYDDRFRFREPPHFLDPIQSAWRVQRYREQSPAL